MSRYLIGSGIGGHRDVLLRMCGRDDGTLTCALTYAICCGYKDVVIDLLTTNYVCYDNLVSIVQAGYAKGQNELAKHVEETYLKPLSRINNDLSSRLSS